MTRSFKFAPVVLTACLLLGSPSSGAQQPTPEKVQVFDGLQVTVPDFPAEGLILDIGGGGEGVIGQVKAKQVIAVDLSRRELEEAPEGPLLKIAMDARDLKFLDGVFPTVTVFFTFMYISPDDHEKVFSEIFRVLQPGGRLLIWDVIFPKKTDPNKDYCLFRLSIQIPAKEILTGYGVRFPDSGQGLHHFKDLAKKAGFVDITGSENQNWFYLEVKKPESN